MPALSATIIQLCVVGIILNLVHAYPEVGKWYIKTNVSGPYLNKFPKSLYAGTDVIINIGCHASTNEEVDIDISLWMNILMCWNDYLPLLDVKPGNLSKKLPPRSIRATCGPSIILPEILPDPSYKHDGVASVANNSSKSPSAPQDTKHEPKGRVYTVPADGLYILSLHMQPQISQTVNITIEVKMLGPHGYLSAVDWPLLPFYGTICLVYVVFGLVWLAVSFCQWRDLLRVQFWIGAVILLGMLEKATFYAVYQSLNATGEPVRAAVLLAELVSCAKRTLARMLVIIVSLGFGIVKPRLGAALHRVVLAGTLYFILAAIESYLRVGPITDPSAGRQLLLASVPLAVLDSFICWWIFSSLAQTTRTLRLRRNSVKLSLYRHFTNTLIFAVVSSLIFMLYSIHYHRLAECLTDWKALWVDDAYWHLLFSLLLLVIMVLWRPGNNNQRYAFSPLLDAPEDEDDDEDDDQFVNDAFGVKMRGTNRSASPKPKSTNTAEDDLKWVEENIPASLPDTALPVLDSDEEIMTTKFEVSKMQ